MSFNIVGLNLLTYLTIFTYNLIEKNALTKSSHVTTITSFEEL